MGAYDKREVSSPKVFQVPSTGRWAIFQVVARTNEKGYILDLFSQYNMSTTFNIFYLSPFDVDDDSKMNPCEERGMMRTIKEI